MFDEMKKKMDAVIGFVGNDLKQIKTGRAKPSLIEDVMVEAYGSLMHLKELASISAPDTHLLTVTPWDRSVLPHIEKALAKGNLGVNPVVDGQMIRIALPALTQERREEMVKLVKQQIESGKQLLRGVRNDYKKLFEDQKGNSGISEDDIKRQLEEMQKHFDAWVEKLEQVGKEKEAELMQI